MLSVYLKSSHASVSRVLRFVVLAGILLMAAYVASFWYPTRQEKAVAKVSQVGREFTPGHLDLQRGDTVEIVNDDADFTHHTYINSESLTFDSGDQAPGRSVDIRFSKPGAFEVLCGVHPKMRLTVTVQ
jgi:plastocyanin